MRAFIGATILTAIAGCGGGTTTPTNEAGTAIDAAVVVDTGIAEDAFVPATDTGASGTDTGVDVCAYVDTIDRGCTADADCHFGYHQTNCCGSSVVIGFRDTEQSEYATNESACQASYPACGCPAMPATTDSGEVVTDTMSIHVACVGVGPTMQCRTYVNNRPPDGV